VIGAVRQAIDRFRGTGSAALTLPPMDGALRPNQALEEATVVLAAPGADNLARDGERIFFSSANRLMELDLTRPEQPTLLAEFGANIACLTVDGAGTIAVGLDDGTVCLRAPDGRETLATAVGPAFSCPTALLFGEGALYVCHGSSKYPPSVWKRDLMERNAGGSLWRLDPGGGAPQCLAVGLAFPQGLVLGPAGELVFAESWRHRLVSVPAAGGAVSALLDHLPAYPARLAQAGDGYWLAAFAPRNRLIEFVLSERSFCARMIENIEPEYWIAPDLSPDRSFLQPLQGGAIKRLGILKPWAPSLSYGLLVRLNAAFEPVASYHSRADGRRHGVTSCVDIDGRVLVACKGAGEIVSVVSDAPREGSPP